MPQDQLNAVRDNPTKINHILANCTIFENRIELLKEAVDVVLPPDGATATSLLATFISGAASQKLRDAAANGQ